MTDLYKDKNILVTGGAGSIGSALVRKLLGHGPTAVRVLDINETGLFDLGNDLDDERIRLLIGDVRDKERLVRAVEDIDVIFHAAALKHVPLCEVNPFEAVQTNVQGTKNLIEAAIQEEVDTFLTISTDKAVNPVNVMGASKLLAERLTVSANLYEGGRTTAFGCVRFGNVLNSRGSVVPVFAEQIKNGGPITITDKGMTRFIMRIDDAVSLVLSAAERAKGGEIFILKMPTIRIPDLARAMIESAAVDQREETGNWEIEEVGIRPGEKIFEELMIESEVADALETEDMFILDTLKWNPIEGEKVSIDSYRSDTAEFLDVEQIKELLRDV